MGSGGREVDYIKGTIQKRRVNITKPYWISQTEINQAIFGQVSGHNPSKHSIRVGPVETVTWQDAIDFCQRLSEKTGLLISLPTEVQWEYACRAGDAGPYSEGIRTSQYLDRIAHYRQRSPCPVGSLSANRWGLKDMHGNVWEWCLDDFAQDANSADEKAWILSDSLSSAKVIRGGGFRSKEHQLMSSYRNFAPPDSAEDDLGFRIVINLD